MLRYLFIAQSFNGHGAAGSESSANAASQNYNAGFGGRKFLCM